VLRWNDSSVRVAISALLGLWRDWLWNGLRARRLAFVTAKRAGHRQTNRDTRAFAFGARNLDGATVLFDDLT
jgi:hypothetical protein